MTVGAAKDGVYAYSAVSISRGFVAGAPIHLSIAPPARRPEKVCASRRLEKPQPRLPPSLPLQYVTPHCGAEPPFFSQPLQYEPNIFQGPSHFLGNEVILEQHSPRRP